MATVNLGQVAALIQSVSAEPLAEGAEPTVRNVGTKANAQFVFGIPKVELTNEVAAGNGHAVTSDAVSKALVKKGFNFGTDKTTTKSLLESGVYLYLTNLHPSVTTAGIYIINVASTPAYNKVITCISESTVNVSISQSNNELTVTTNNYFRGMLIKLAETVV
nr:MAG TPA: hypothetical protein [Caudoviricetes sp.]